jgi:NAD-dependent deacetylase
VIELHGSIWTVRCVECGNSSENRDVPIKILPRCHCGGLLRPAVVWFGEPLPEEALFRAFEASSNADVMLVVGTSGVVQPAASLALRARDAGTFVAELNPEATPLSSSVDLRLAGKAGELMPTLL